LKLFHEGHRLGTHHRGQHAQHRAEIADDQARPVCRVFVALRAGFFHGITGVGQRLRGPPHRRRHFRIGAAFRN
jgi:hypothetical protein